MKHAANSIVVFNDQHRCHSLPHLIMPPSRVAFSRRAHDQAADKREKPTRRSLTQCPDKVYEGVLSSSDASRGCLSSARRAASLAFWICPDFMEG